jgi:tetratricopeptide (TPR) repeat protein
LLNLKEYEKAILCNDNAIKLNALCAPAHCNKGVALFHLNRVSWDFFFIFSLFNYYSLLSYVKFTEALAEYNKAIEINPNYSDAYFNREITLEKMGKKLDDSLSKKTDGVLLMNSSKLQSFNKTIDINTLFS